jgi:hypothetical protein
MLIGVIDIKIGLVSLRYSRQLNHPSDMPKADSSPRIGRKLLLGIRTDCAEKARILIAHRPGLEQSSIVAVGISQYLDRRPMCNA